MKGGQIAGEREREGDIDVSIPLFQHFNLQLYAKYHLHYICRNCEKTDSVYFLQNEMFLNMKLFTYSPDTNKLIFFFFFCI